MDVFWVTKIFFSNFIIFLKKIASLRSKRYIVLNGRATYKKSSRDDSTSKFWFNVPTQKIITHIKKNITVIKFNFPTVSGEGGWIPKTPWICVDMPVNGFIWKYSETEYKSIIGR